MKAPLGTSAIALRRARRLTGWLALLAAATGGFAGQNDRIAISSTAAPAYVRPTGADGKPKLETYLFAQGRFFGGNSADGKMDRMAFDDVLKTLVPGLAKQNYLPTRETATADLLIRVYWGATETYEDPRGKQFATEALNQELAAVNSAVADSGIADAGRLNLAIAETEGTEQGQDSTIKRNAALLGFDRVLGKERRNISPSSEEYTLSVELNEERYFVVLMAYDYQFMQKEHKPKLLWVTRLSIRAPSRNFTEALPALAFAGGDVFGRQVDGLLKVRPNNPEGHVKLHELEVLGTVEEKTGAPAKR